VKNNKVASIRAFLYVSGSGPLDSKLIKNSNAESPRIQMTKAVTIIFALVFMCNQKKLQTSTRQTTKNYELQSSLLEHLDAKLFKSLPELALILNLLQPVPSSNRLAREKDRRERSVSICNLSQKILDAVAPGY
jgi:hypothetical protein